MPTPFAQTDKPELLAPAGTIEAALVAFDAGADAVYAGLPAFNARQRSRNLTEEQLGSLITWARRHKRRVYVTLNTLIKETELEDVLDILGRLYLLRPHAVIVQDLGVLRLLRRHFPELPVHASTQMGVHNSMGVRFLESLGVERVILERQITLDELRSIRARTAVGIEVFVFGALCCSLSGVCLFSSWIGGHSGNRGRCTQPCRRRYFTPQGNGFFFSPADFDAVAAIPELRAIGVAGLKIEGRLRGPDYVRRTVSACRIVLDAPPDQVDSAVEEAQAILAGQPSRKLHGPFRTSDDFRDVIQETSPPAAGRCCGSVLSVRGNVLRAQLSSPLAVGDVIRLEADDGADGPSAPVLEIRCGGRRVTTARTRGKPLRHPLDGARNSACAHLPHRTCRSGRDRPRIPPARLSARSGPRHRTRLRGETPGADSAVRRPRLGNRRTCSPRPLPESHQCCAR